MSLDPRQTRRLQLADAIAFPTPFPTVGDIWCESGELLHERDGFKEGSLLVYIQEPRETNADTTRVVLARDVAAIFVADEKATRVDDFENGAWYVRPVEKRDKGFERMRKFLGSRETPKRGIVFVPENRPVVTHHEVTQTAGAASHFAWSPFCEPDTRCEPC